MLSRALGKQRWVFKQGLNHAKSRIRDRTASTWISLHAHRNMLLQNDCCDLASPDAQAHTESPPAAFLRLKQSKGGCLSTGEIMLSRATKSMEEVGA